MAFYKEYMTVAEREVLPENPEIETSIWSLKDSITHIFFIPTKYRVYYKHIADSSHKKVGEGLPNKQWELVQIVGKKFDIPVTDLTPALIEESDNLLQEQILTYWRDDTHWNKHGIAVAADMVGQVLRLHDASHGEHPPLDLLPAEASPLVDTRQFRVIGEIGEGIRVLEELLRRAPDDEEAVQLQIQLLSDAGRYAELDELLTPRLAERPKDVQLLLLQAEANAALGEHYDAIRFYERARLAGATETAELFNHLAAEYYAEERLEEARELLQRSLDLTPEQPEVRRLLERIRERASGSGDALAVSRPDDHLWGGQAAVTDSNFVAMYATRASLPAPSGE